MLLFFADDAVIDLCCCIFVHWDYCSGIYSSFGTLRQFSAGLTSADVVFQTLSSWPCQSICHSCGILYSLFILLCASTRTQSYLLWPLLCSSSLSHSSYSTVSVFLFLSSTCIVCSPLSGGLSVQHNFNLEDFISSPRGPNNPANKIFCCFQLRLSVCCTLVSLRGATGSCLPLSWCWRKWLRWMKGTTLAWPSIPLLSPSTRDAPSASLSSLVKTNNNNNKITSSCFPSD